MAVNGPVLLVEDDIEEQQKIKKVFSEIGLSNPVEMFANAEQALVYLDTTEKEPFIILTKMILPGINGLNFLDRIYQSDHLRKKSIPFIFFANADCPQLVEAAFDRRVQGYFLKPKSPVVLKLTLMSITDYWLRSTHPNIN